MLLQKFRSYYFDLNTRTTGYITFWYIVLNIKNKLFRLRTKQIIMSRYVSFIVGVTKYHNIGYLSCGEKHTQNSIYKESIWKHFRFLFSILILYAQQ